MLFSRHTGLPQRYRDSVRAIQPGLPLFLYNYTTHQLHGVYEVKVLYEFMKYSFLLISMKIKSSYSESILPFFRLLVLAVQTLIQRHGKTRNVKESLDSQLRLSVALHILCCILVHKFSTLLMSSLIHEIMGKQILMLS